MVKFSPGKSWPLRAKLFPEAKAQTVVYPQGWTEDIHPFGTTSPLGINFFPRDQIHNCWSNWTPRGLCLLISTNVSVMSRMTSLTVAMTVAQKEWQSKVSKRPESHHIHMHICKYIGMPSFGQCDLEPILRLLNLQLQRKRCSRLERFPK
jgi:hypothetical protein